MWFYFYVCSDLSLLTTFTQFIVSISLHSLVIPIFRSKGMKLNCNCLLKLKELVKISNLSNA